MDTKENQQIAAMAKNIDNSIINKYKADYRNDPANRDLWDSEVYSGTTNMAVSGAKNGWTTIFDYAGGTVRYNVAENTRDSEFDWGDGTRKTISGYMGSKIHGVSATVRRTTGNFWPATWTFSQKSIYDLRKGQAERLFRGRNF
jgi:hypothetical protein